MEPMTEKHDFLCVLYQDYDHLTVKNHYHGQLILRKALPERLFVQSSKTGSKVNFIVI